MGKSKSLAQQIADLDDPIPKGMRGSKKICVRRIAADFPQILTQKMAQRRGAMGRVDRRIVMMDWLGRSIMLLLGRSIIPERFNMSNSSRQEEQTSKIRGSCPWTSICRITNKPRSIAQ